GCHRGPATVNRSRTVRPEREMRSAMSTGSTTATRFAPGNSLRSRDLPVNHRTRSDLRERRHTLWNASPLVGGVLLRGLRGRALGLRLGRRRAAGGGGDRGDRGSRQGAAVLVVGEAVHVVLGVLAAVVAVLGVVLRPAARAPAAAPRGLRGLVPAVPAAVAAVLVLAVHVDQQAAAVAVLAGVGEGLDQPLAH